MNTLAIDIGGTKFTIAVFDQNRIVRRESRATDRAGGKAWMLEQIAAIARDWQRNIPLHRCGIGFGGPVQFAKQRVALSTHVGGWADFPLPAQIEDLLRVPVIMDNDANVGALGEGAYGAGAGYSPLFYMTLSTGIGGGILVDGKIYRGADSYAGEIGHLTIRPDGPECLCGARGCYERMCCGLWLEKDHGKSAKELMQDPEFVRRYVVDLALGLKACIMLLNPARIVVGGGIAKAGAALFGPLDAELRRQITAWSRARIDVVPAGLGDDSVLYGALALAKQALAISVRRKELDMNFAEGYKSELLKAIEAIDIEKVEQAIELFKQARAGGKHVFVCGNGGSASTASHFVTDMVKGASYNREPRFRIMALTDSLPTITAYSNDVSYDCIFVEQLKNFAQPGDLVVGISGSGNSPNVLRAIEYANSIGCRTVALTGRDGGRLGPLANHNIQVPVPHMGRIEDAHLIVCHMICYYFMDTEK